jgi:uncharacterized protein YdhG (YjbR/CyaY superfamily)
MEVGRIYLVHRTCRELFRKISRTVPECTRETIAMRDQLATIDEYIASFPPDVGEKLQGIRAVIRRAVPDAEEAIRYGIPTFRLDGRNLVHFAAFRDHLGFFPTASGVEQFRKEISVYTLRKGTIQFPLNEPVPYDLVERIARFRAGEIRKKQV